MESFSNVTAAYFLDHYTILFGFGKGKVASSPHTLLPSIYCTDFFLKNEKKWLIFEDYKVFQIDSLPFYEDFSKISFDYPEKAFKEQVRQAQQASLSKVVITNKLHGEVKVKKEEAVGYFINMAKNSDKTLMPYGLFNKSGFFGATPETLFTIKRKNKDYFLKTMALAGTAQQSDKLLDDPKMRIEHDIVIKDIKDKLSIFGKVFVGDTTTLKLKSFYHLHTPIEVCSQTPICFDYAVKILHPTPALGAYPSHEGASWLREHEYHRNYFGAPFGLQFGGHMHCLVAIRQVSYTPKNISFMAGCGIVKESCPEQEWQEWLLKINSVQSALNQPNHSCATVLDLNLGLNLGCKI